MAEISTTKRTGYWDCDCGRECRHKDGPERLPNCRAEWVQLTPAPVQTTAKPSKAILTALEKVFAAEIEGRLPFQSKAAIYRDLMAAGLVEPMQRSFGGGVMSVTVSGYAMTIKGNYLYCSNCESESNG